MSVLGRVLLSVLLGLGLTGAAAHAQTPAPVMPGVPAKVQVRVQVIRASSTAPARIDPRLTAIAAALKQTPFIRFEWVREDTVRLADGQRQAIDLGSGRRLVVALERHDATSARLEATYERPGMRPAVTSLRVHRDRAFFYSLRGDKPGEALLLELDVRY